MYEAKLIKALEKMPVFSLADVAKIVGSREYSKKLLHRMVKENAIKRVMRDKYTFQDDDFIIAPFLYLPSYISCASALSYHGLISQIPTSLFLISKKRSKVIKYKRDIVYNTTKHYFGFNYIEYNGVKIPIAEPEKAFIDSIGIHPLHIVAEAIDELDKNKLIEYAKKCNQIKRIGYLLEKRGDKTDIKKLSNKYIYLDSLGIKKGKKDKKWKLIVNY